ncbi:MAG: TonB-dependent receptor, partial [Acidobacteria bacterium]|nr:TonB-dependent receptor [Acidobacteriota bacterium]
MVLNRFKPGLFLLVLIATLVMSPVAFGQATTGSLAGSVASADDGALLPGVTIEALHVPTGTRYSSVTGDNGRFMIPNVKVGGPYKVTATLEGFQPSETGGITVNLGAIAEVPVFKIKMGAFEESIVVTAEADPIINPNRSGSTSAVSTDAIETLPTVNRSLQDFARTNPYFVVDAQDFSSTRLSVAGRNNRYNTIQIDGAVNNDLFGLAYTGTPGGQTDAQPVSLDALAQIQLVVSPYDVKQGGFTGGGVNVVTRSGSNDLEGSVFYSERNESLVGDGPFDRPIANFDQTLYGGRVGGRIIRDKLFFFVSGERNEKENPTGVSADGTTGTVYGGSGTGQTPSASIFRDFLIDEYGYDPGSLGDFGGQTDSDLALVKFDWTINNQNTATFRHNYIDAGRDVIADRSSTRYRFESAIYNQADETNSSVVQVNSIFSANAFNEARIGLQTIKDKRATPVTFPTVEVGGTGARSGALHAGTERFSGANSLDQDVLEITDDFTLLKGNHTFTIGTHNEIFEFKNLFLSEFYGYWYFPTLDAFMAGTPTEYRISYANGDDPRRPTQFEVRQYGIYAGDQWRVNNNLTLTYGMRLDKPDYVDKPSFNSTVQTRLGYNTSATASETTIASPRVGFNWDPTGDARQQIRGGIGIFAGRTPYVWLSNTYGNTGVESTALLCNSACITAAGLTFNPDPNNQPRSGAAGSTFSVDLIDPKFKMPHVLRATLGYDRELPWGIRGTA